MTYRSRFLSPDEVKNLERSGMLLNEKPAVVCRICGEPSEPAFVVSTEGKTYWLKGSPVHDHCIQAPGSREKEKHVIEYSEDQLLIMATLPKHLKDWKIENLETPAPPGNPPVSIIHEIAKGKNAILRGRSGAGKTTYGTLAIIEAIQTRRITAKYAKDEAIRRRIRQAIMEDGIKEIATIAIEALCVPDLLFWDEFGSIQNPSKLHTEVMKEVLEIRSAEDRQTIIGTEYGEQQMKSRIPPNLVSRAYSLVAGGRGLILQFNGPDFRSEKGVP